MSVKRVNVGRNHHYIDEDTGQRIPGATTIGKDGIPKPALVNWSSDATAEYTLDHWDELSALPPSERLKRMKKARYESSSAAAAKGTKIHRLAQRLVDGTEVQIPDGLEGYVQAYVRFLDEFQVEPLLVEFLVWSALHGFCGTGDLVADLLNPDDPDGGTLRWLLDLKTSRSGVWGETALQLAPYRFAETWHDEDGNEIEPVEVDRCGVVWIRPDGYDLVPVEAEEDQFRDFLYVKEVARFVNTSRELVGEPIISPITSTYSLRKED